MPSIIGLMYIYIFFPDHDVSEHGGMNQIILLVGNRSRFKRAQVYTEKIRNVEHLRRCIIEAYNSFS